jgi:pantoate--beta-alanine ligase
MRAALASAPGLGTDYAAVVDAATLEPLERVDRPARALLAARLGAVRLIDNGPLLPSSA